MRNYFTSTKPCKPGVGTRLGWAGYVLPEEFELSETLKGMLISSAACGDAELAASIAEHYDTIVCLSGAGLCVTPDIRMLEIQIGLTDHAIDKARGLIDRVTTRGDGSGESHYRGTNYSDSEASKRSGGVSTFTSRSSSANNFTRTSKSRETSSSTSRAESNGFFQNVGLDRSRRQQNSESRSFDKATSTGDGGGSGSSTHTSNRTSTAATRTAPNPRFSNSIIPAPVPTLVSASGINTPGLASQIIQKWAALNNINLNIPTCDPSVPNSEAVPTVCGNLTPSVGSGFRSTFNASGSLSVGIASPFGSLVLATSWSSTSQSSNHFRAQHVCSAGSGKSAGRSTSRLNYSQNDGASSDGETTVLQIGYDQRDVKREGTSTRSSTSKLHAESAGSMDSCGESHSSSARKAHGEAANSGESMSRSEGHSENQINFKSIAKTIAEARYFNQVFKQLVELREILWERMLDLRDRARASRSPVSSCAPTRRLTKPPLFWFSNAWACSRCLTPKCNCHG